MENHRPSLLNMPELVLDNIIKKTDIFARISLEKCNKALRRYMKNVKTNYEEINILFEKNKITLKISDASSNVSIRYCLPSISEYGGLLVKEVFFFERCVSDLVAIVGRSNVTIDELKMKADLSICGNELELVLDPKISRFYETKEFMSNFVIKMGAKQLKVKTMDYFHCFKKTDQDLMQILQFLQPGTLENLLIWEVDKEETLRETTGSQQWKQAKELCLTYNSSVPLKELTHLTRIYVTGREVTLEEMKLLIESAVFHAEKFEKYDFCCCEIQDEAVNYAQNSPYNREEEPLVVGELRILNIDIFNFYIGRVTPEDLLPRD